MTTTRRKRGPQDGVFQKANGWWYLDYYDREGRRHRPKASLSYEVAKAKYRQQMVALDRGEITGIRDDGLRFDHFARQTWLPLTRGRVNALWGTHIAQTLTATLLPAFGTKALARITINDIETWATTRRQDTKASTFNKNVWVLKNIFKLAEARGYVRTDPTRHLTRRKESAERVRYLEDGEREKLLASANPELAAYVLVALETGGRRSELCRLRWTDLDLKRRLVTFARTKNGETRHVPMNHAVWTFFQARPRRLDPSAPVLPVYDDPHSITQAFDRLVKRVGLADFTFHDLRHDFASRLAMAGVPLLTISKLLGHKTIAMTMRYAHLSPDHLRDAMQVLDRARTRADLQSEPSSLGTR